MVSFRAALLVLLASFLVAACKDGRSAVSQDVIGAFQGSCTTTGRWTQAALAHNQALIAVLEQLKAKDSCKPFISTLNTVQALSGQINSILQNQSYTDYRVAEENFQELTLALSGMQPGTDAADMMSSAVVSAQIDLAQRRAISLSSSIEEERNRYVSSTQQLATLMQGILSSTNSGLAACLQQSPAASVQLATNVMAIGGSFVSPIVGVGAQIVGQLINTGVEYVRTAAPETAIYSLYADEMPTALGCGLESMSELYCEANDAFSLLKIQAEGYPGPERNPVPIWEGMDLLSRRMPVLNRWLQGVKNGVLPTDFLEAERQNGIWKKLHKLDEYYRTVYSTFRDGEKIYTAATDSSQKLDILVKTLQDVAYTLAPPRGSDWDPSNPFRDKTTDSADIACWLVWGIDVAECKKTDSEHPSGYSDIKEYIRKVLLATTPNADFSLLNRNWAVLFGAVDKLVTLQFSQTITADPQSLLAAARQGPTTDGTPREILTRLSNFLQHMLDQDDRTNPQLPGLLQNTMSMINDVMKILDDTSCTDGAGQPIDCEVKRLKQISDIFDRFELRRSLQFFVDRINNFVEWDLEYKLRNGMIPQDIQEILISAGSDIRERLSAAGQLNNLTPLVQDLNKARSVVQGNLKVFREFFSKSLGRAVVDLKKAADTAGEPAEGADRPNGQILGQLCTLVLATGQEWPKDVSWEICSKAVLSSIYPDPKGELTIRVDQLRKDLEGKPFDSRVCAFHRFLRAGRLAEILRQRRKPLSAKAPGSEPGVWDRASLDAFVAGAFGSF